jgi:hypothetical protein
MKQCRYCLSRGSLVAIPTGYRLDDQGIGVRVPRVSRILTSYRPHRFWGPPNLVINAYGGILPRGKAGESWS